MMRPRNNNVFVSALLLLLFFSSDFLASQKYALGFSQQQDIVIFKPLSERGEKLFARTNDAITYSLGTCTQQLCNQCGSGVPLSSLCASGTLGNCSTSVCTDIFTLFNVVSAVTESLFRLIDINGHYYKKDAQTILEREFYQVDLDRQKIYQKKNAIEHEELYRADEHYIKTKIYDLEIKIAALGRIKKSAIRTAYKEVRDKLKTVLLYIESQCVFTQEEVYKSDIVILADAIEKVRATKFKNKATKKRLLTEYQDELARKECQYKSYQVQQAEKIYREKELQKQRDIQQIFTQFMSELENEVRNYGQLYALYSEHIPTIITHIDKRVELFAEIKNGTVKYSTEAYTLNHAVSLLFQNEKHAADFFISCYGNQYQQYIHQESIAVLDAITQVSFNTVLSQQRTVIVTFAEVACAYNKAGQCYKAMQLLDFCWGFLSCGSTILQGVIEGAVGGVCGAVQDLVEHPVQTAVSVFVGSSFILTYQLSKILYTVADLSITAFVNPTAAADKWNAYLAPINTVINAIRAQEIEFKEATKVVTQFGVQWYTQAKLLGGLNFFYSGIKTKTDLFFHKNSSVALQQYLHTPDGILMKVAADAARCQVQASSRMPLQHAVTLDGIVTYETVFSTIDYFNALFSNSSNFLKKIISVMDAALFERGAAGILTLANNLIKVGQRPECIAEMIARLKQEKFEGEVASPRGPKKDDDDNNNFQVRPNGVYKGVGYHHVNSKGCKNPAPKDGQRALDNSKIFKSTSARRIGISEGEIVILDQTVPGEYHGHVRTWHELQIASDKDSQKIMAFLLKNQWVNSKGKILI